MKLRLALLALLVLAACKKPVCTGNLSDDDVAKWKAKVQKGEPACEELAQAKVDLATDGVNVNGQHIEVYFRGEKKDAIPHLAELLGKDREAWLRIHPGAQFKGNVDFTIPKERPAGHGVSVAWVLVSEGFSHATIHSGDTTLVADLWPGPGNVASAVAHVERQNGSEYHLRFSGPGAPSDGRRIVSPDVNDLSTQIAREWTAVDGAPRALVVRTATGTFYDELRLAKELLALPALSHATVAFEVGRPLN